MATKFVNVSPGDVIGPRAKIRASFRENLVGLATPGDEILKGYTAVQEQAPSKGIGYVTSPNVAAPGDEAVTIDIVRGATVAPLPAGTLATALNEIPYGLDLVRFELVPRDTGSAEDQAGREEANQAAEKEPTGLNLWLKGIGSFLKFLAIVLVVLVVLYFVVLR